MQFYKYHGAGNDFILIDSRDSDPGLNESQVARLCDRHFGIGADGLMLLLPSSGYDFRMRYYNSDGREGTMCGNGGRCITAFARDRGMVNDRYAFEAIDGIHHSWFEKDGTISLGMNNVSHILRFSDGFFIDTGSPHFVMEHPDPHAADMTEMGSKYRHDPRFGSGGANINLVRAEKNRIVIATFERGVEAETLACGTGSVAAAIAAAEKNGNGFGQYVIEAKGGQLAVHLKKEGDSYISVVLSGPAAFVYSGEIVILP